MHTIVSRKQIWETVYISRNPVFILVDILYAVRFVNKHMFKPKQRLHIHYESLTPVQSGKYIY